MTEFSPLTRSFLALLWLTALALLTTTSGWQYYHDTPLLNYAATMMVEHNWLPYRDIFETTMPATFLVHYGIIALGLEGNLPFILLGLGLYGLLGLVGFAILAPMTRLGAWAFMPFFWAFILSSGPSALMQREILGLVPISLAFLLMTRTRLDNHGRSQAAIGLLFGIACLIKPQFALGAPVMVLAAAALAQSQGYILAATRGIVVSVMAFVIPIGLTALFLWQAGALDRLLFILTEYTPLYIQQTQSHGFTTPEIRRAYLWETWIDFGNAWQLLPGLAVLTLFALGMRQVLERRLKIVLSALVMLCVIYGLMPIASGQFWGYHYYPFVYFAIMGLSALLFCLKRTDMGAIGKGFALAVVTLTFFAHAPRYLKYDQIRDTADQRVAQAHAMRDALLAHLPQGARVQPLDWTSGSLHAMMLTRNRLATRFMYDFHFAHHVSSPVNKTLRAELMAELEANPPEGILVGLKPARVHGLDVSYDFPELEAFRDSTYVLVEDTEIFRLYRRRDIDRNGSPGPE